MLPEQKIANRDQLIVALHAGAELEHLLLCQYLYAGYSVRRSLADFPEGTDEALARETLDRVRPWLSQLYLIARQEMDHLGIVCNLLAAVGAEPYFARPAFPQPPIRSLVGVLFGLDRFGETSLRRFVWYERPSHIRPSFPADCLGLEGWDPTDVTLTPVRKYGIHTLGELYGEIGRAFDYLPASEVFRGDPDRQLGDVFSFRVKLQSVTNREGAHRAIEQILSEGEGIGLSPVTSTCHFQRMTEMLTGFEEASDLERGFDPTLPVVSNPLVSPHPDGFPASVVTRPETLAVMRCFNAAYNTMLVMLHSFFHSYTATESPEPRPQAALFYAAFFPLMTMVIRPLGEVLARMPAGDDFPGQNAGASFEIVEPIKGQIELDWYSNRLLDLTRQTRQAIEGVPERLRPVLVEMVQNLTSVRLHLEHIWSKGG